MFFLNNNIGWISGGRATGIGDTRDNVIIKTTDGGKTWFKQLDIYIQKIAPWGLFDIFFINEDYGIAVGQPFGTTPYYFTTTDGGNNWHIDTIPFGKITPYSMRVFGINDRLYVTWARDFYQYKYSNLGINSILSENYDELFAFPNPFKSEITISGDDIEKGIYTAEIYNTLGELVYNKKVNYPGELRLIIDSPPGVYHLRLSGKKNYFKTIVKE